MSNGPSRMKEKAAVGLIQLHGGKRQVQGHTIARLQSADFQMVFEIGEAAPARDESDQGFSALRGAAKRAADGSRSIANTFAPAPRKARL